MTHIREGRAITGGKADKDGKTSDLKQTVSNNIKQEVRETNKT